MSNSLSELTTAMKYYLNEAVSDCSLAVNGQECSICCWRDCKATDGIGIVADCSNIAEICTVLDICTGDGVAGIALEIFEIKIHLLLSEDATSVKAHSHLHPQIQLLTHLQPAGQAARRMYSFHPF